MSDKPVSRPVSLGWRLFWALMLLGHAPAWIAIVADRPTPLDAAVLLRWLLLTLSQAFFLLKLLDVRWLRLPADRRALLAVTLVFTLLHGDVAARVLRDGSTAETAVVLAFLAEGAALVAGAALARVVLRVLARSPRRERCRSRDRWLAVLAWLTASTPPPRFLLLARACRVNRAPPA